MGYNYGNVEDGLYCIENQDQSGRSWVFYRSEDPEQWRFYVTEEQPGVAKVYHKPSIVPLWLATFVGYTAKERGQEMVKAILDNIRDLREGRQPEHRMFCCWKWDRIVPVNEGSEWPSMADLDKYMNE